MESILIYFLVIIPKIVAVLVIILKIIFFLVAINQTYLIAN